MTRVLLLFELPSGQLWKLNTLFGGTTLSSFTEKAKRYEHLYLAFGWNENKEQFLYLNKNYWQ